MSKMAYTPYIREVKPKGDGAKGYQISPSQFNAISEKEEYEYLKIDIFMKTPTIISFPWICFDGVISHHLLNLTLGRTFNYLNTHKPIKSKVKHYIKSPILHDPLPSTSVIKWFKQDGSEINPKYDVTRHIVTKKWCDDYAHLIKTKTKYILKAGGDYLNFFFKWPALLAFRGEVYAYGKKNSMETILRFVNGIGKKANMGNGSVHKITVSKSDKRRSYYDWEEGISLRPIPIRLLKSWDKTKVGRVAWKPPYWSKEKLEMCVAPFTECELLSE